MAAAAAPSAACGPAALPLADTHLTPGAPSEPAAAAAALLNGAASGGKSCRSEAKSGGRCQASKQQQRRRQRRRREDEEEEEDDDDDDEEEEEEDEEEEDEDDEEEEEEDDEDEEEESEPGRARSHSGGGQPAPPGPARGPQHQPAANAASRTGARGGGGHQQHHQQQQQRGRDETAAPASGNRRQSLENSSDGEPLSRMDSEDSISSTLMDMDSTISSGRSTPALINGHGSTTSGKNITYNCCWDQCQTSFCSSPDLADHIRSIHVDGQRGGVFVCLWKGCKVYNTPSTSQSWLQRHMLTHSGDKPFKCVVGGCTASFASQGGLARHVPTHFSQQNSAKVTSQPKVKEESPSKAVMNKRRRLKNKRRRSLPRPHDFFDAQTMDAIRHRAICFNLSTHIESHGNGHSVVFHSTVIARRKEDSGKVKVLLHWTPEDILPDVWVNENDRSQLRTKTVHLSKLPQDAALLLDPNIYRTMPQKRLKRR
ncbi:zinc finger protein AEBP2 isoform X2 [Pristis pectinata]|uniref:zinc finger protein AEBP2 isoform X2 n=1 Tax=Pristis pectinata TaxID=685728 RepID=UPI00223CB938|nr:zinc finger protein AEBP2 isoform X2 [Pristis pectinata]